MADDEVALMKQLHDEHSAAPDRFTQSDMGRATPSMSDVSGASCSMW